MAASNHLVLDREYVGVRRRIAEPRAATAPRVVRPPPIAARVSRPGRTFKLVRRAYLGAAVVMVLAFAAVLLVGAGWQPVAAAAAIFAGMGALTGFLAGVTLGDGIRSR